LDAATRKIIVKIQLYNPDGLVWDRDRRRRETRRRQLLTIVFAISLILVTGVATAQSPQTEHPQPAEVAIQYGDATDVPVAHSEAVVDQHRKLGGAVARPRLKGDARPAYVDLSAELANFDADPDPEGWRVDVVLRDRKDRPVTIRSYATFELIPRVSTADHQRFVNGSRNPIRWSMPLEFGDDSVARVKLVLRQPMATQLGWSSAIYPPSGMRWRNAGRNVGGLHASSRARTAATSDLRNLVGTPSSGELRVRVSVPTQGVYEAVTPVWIRPSVLVDTQWPYR
jgi:hypothetical protein